MSRVAQYAVLAGLSPKTWARKKMYVPTSMTIVAFMGELVFSLTLANQPGRMRSIETEDQGRVQKVAAAMIVAILDPDQDENTEDHRHPRQSRIHESQK